MKALILGFALVAWVAIGLWLEMYEKLDAGIRWSSCAIRRASAATACSA